jgi:hypothetical protein
VPALDDAPPFAGHVESSDDMAPGQALGLMALYEILHDAVEETQVIIDLLIAVEFGSFFW